MNAKPLLTSAYLGAAILFATPALADPCRLPVSGFHAGQTITGRVAYIGDGDSLCLRRAGGLLEIRIADFSAPEIHEPGGKRAKAVMSRLALGKPAVCTVRKDRKGRSTRSFDRVIASCAVGGVSLGDQMRRAGAREGGR